MATNDNDGTAPLPSNLPPFLAAAAAYVPHINTHTLHADVRDSATARFAWGVLDPFFLTMALIGLCVTFAIMAMSSPDTSALREAYLHSLRIVGLFTLTCIISLVTLSYMQASIRASKAKASQTNQAQVTQAVMP